MTLTRKTPLRSKTRPTPRPERQPAPLYRIAPDIAARIVTGPAQLEAAPKAPRIADRAWLRVVHEIECCVLCGRHGIQAAHSNQDRGKGQKASDCLTAALCPTCHVEIDSGKTLAREERRARMDRAIVLTLQELVRRGLVGVLA